MIVEAIKAETERQRREKQAETQSVTKTGGAISQLIDEQVDYNKDRTDTKLATTFNTNRTYINEAARLKDQKPEVFEQVKSGEKTLTQVKKEERIEEIKRQKEDIDSGKITTLSDKYSVISIDPPWPLKRMRLSRRSKPKPSGREGRSRRKRRALQNQMRGYVTIYC